MKRLARFDIGLEDEPLREELAEALGRVLTSGRYHLGVEGAALERELLAFLEAPALDGAGVGSGTDAITLALLALGVGEGDEVVTVANAGVPGPTAIRRAGAEVVFCDVLPESCLIDPASVAAVVGPRTRAILPVHLYGAMADVEALRRAAPRVPIVEDCAQAFGSRRGGRPAGTLGDLAAFSFYPTKNLGALGDAGFIAGDPAPVARARQLRDYGRDAGGVAVALGILSRLDELQAAALRVKLRHARSSLERRRALCAAYDAALPASLVRVGRHTEGEPALHLYVVRTKERARVEAALADAGIETGVHYRTPAHRMPAFANARRGSLAFTEQACNEVLSLPFFPAMTVDDVARVCAVLEGVC